MNSLRTYRIGIIVAIVLLIVVGWFVVKPAATHLPPYLASSAQPDGIKAVLLLLEEKGGRVKEWRQPTHMLPTASGQALLVVEPQSLTDKEQESLLEWVESGNDLLLFSEHPIDWEDLPFEPKFSEGASKERNIQGQGLPEGQSGKARTLVRWQEADGLEPLFYDEQGILAGKVELGAGSVSYFLVPDWLTNRKINELSHFEAVWPHLQENWSVIWIDEYHHGLQETPGLLAIYPGWLVATIIQLSLVLLLFVWWKGKRFGPVYTLREWTVRRGDETLLAVASWYERRSLARDALAHREAYLRQLLHDRWGIHQKADRAQILHSAKQRWSEPRVQKLADVLERLERVRSQEKYSAKQLLADSLLLDEMITELMKE
ncbi:DUF4350 domain-containing protein [Brevibacillus parabrevis]|uniref:DUF4350 domain-containing protein n=1 Tax=Brevibacillus parabrevis TaxID=54914 RepID=UPI001F62002F|nr:DUF4350 domain-containing protein [Brevibacillus parabrevis]MDR4999311.1 DUF4350 domain-containing protein [Brevibacillus parabrevis]